MVRDYEKTQGLALGRGLGCHVLADAVTEEVSHTYGDSGCLDVRGVEAACHAYATLATSTRT
jgi:hypothetical protein